MTSARDLIDPKLCTGPSATLHGEPLPVFMVTRAVGDPTDNLYILQTREGAEVVTQAHSDGSYHVLVLLPDGATRRYSDRDTPHARSIFWGAMAMVYARMERERAKRDAAPPVDP